MLVAPALLLLALLPAPQGRNSAQALPVEFLRRHRPLTEPSWRRDQDLRFGDLDGDGDVDGVMGTGRSPGSLLLLWNTGHGAFRQERRTLFSPYLGAYLGPDAVFPGDLEGDGDVDLIVIAFGYIIPFFNDGTGDFSPAPDAVDLGLSFPTDEIELGDLDGDGDLDVLYVRGGKPGWVRNVAGGVFERVVGAFPPSLPSSLSRPILVDLDQDRDLDALLVDYEGPELLLNDGAGAFTRATNLLPGFPGLGLVRILAVDVDQDNDGDLVLGARYATSGVTLFLYRNDLPTGFVYEDRAFPPETASGEALATLDLDADGDPDLVASNGYSITTLLENVGAHFFVSSAALPGGIVGPEVRVTDLDGDGAEDLVWLFAQRGFLIEGGGPEPWLGDGEGGFVEAGADDTPVDAASWIAAEDVDGDGDLDAVVPEGLLRNDGAGNFDLEPEVFRVGRSLWGTFGDVDGDGDPDFVDVIGTATLFRNDGTGGFFADPGALPDTLGGVLVPGDLGDLDGDGDLDLFLPRSAQGPPTYETVSRVPYPDAVLRNDGSGRFELGPDLPVRHATSWAADLVDMDADGDLDVVVVASEAVLFLRNEGDLVFADGGAALPVGLPGARAVALGDLDGDRDLDVYLGGKGGSRDRMLRNEGTTFVEVPQRTSGNVSVIDLVDVDGDGDLDALTSSSLAQIACCRFARYDQSLGLNDGTGTFSPAAFPPDRDPYIAVGDFDRDGDPDVLTGGKLYRNQTRALAWLVRPRLGHVLELEVRGERRGRAELMGGLTLRTRRAGNLGLLHLDPKSVIFRRPLRLDGDGRAVVRIEVPDDPTLAGTEIYWQALIGAPPRASELEITAF